ncbi:MULTISPECIES: hypothetical protein [unclassified Bradyrhizobium]|uniref:hypothetical protein n=1 Tax=unclassified Bradyrhizobium TaxID=2631580 RepID=UPI002916D32D|nr:MULTISPECIES: hypothetical protein [unclassified Bradyrhizobium]
MSELALETDTRQWVVTISIDKAWSTEDFALIFDLVGGLYAWFARDLIPEDRLRWWMRGFEPIEPTPPPQVIAIKYGSPGFVRFAGLGEAMKQLKELIQYLLDRDQHREEREVAIERARFELARERSDHVIKLLKQAKGYDGSDRKALEVQQFFQQYVNAMETVQLFADERKIEAVSIGRE